jgi:hypothetical protein
MRGFWAGKLNWCLSGLEITDCPTEWLEAAKEAAKDWVFCSFDSLTVRKMVDIDAFFVKRQFEGWGCLVYDVQKEEFTDAPENLDALMSPRCSLLFFRVPHGT